MDNVLKRSRGGNRVLHVSRLLSAGVLVMTLAIVPAGKAVAAGPYAPSADTYTDRNNENANHGSDHNLLLSASTLGGCVETTYLWFKFSIPSTGTTIAGASLALTFESPGSGTVDLELRSSADTTWNETGLMWSNQPALDAGVLATATGVTPGSTATLSSAAFASYLNARQGQTVSLAVRADCDGSVSQSVALDLRARENANGSGASLTLTGPTAVTLVSVIARSGESAALPGFSTAVAVVLALMFLGTSTIARWRKWVSSPQARGQQRVQTISRGKMR